MRALAVVFVLVSAILSAVAANAHGRLTILAVQKEVMGGALGTIGLKTKTGRGFLEIQPSKKVVEVYPFMLDITESAHVLAFAYTSEETRSLLVIPFDDWHIFRDRDEEHESSFNPLALHRLAANLSSSSKLNKEFRVKTIRFDDASNDGEVVRNLFSERGFRLGHSPAAEAALAVKITFSGSRTKTPRDRNAVVREILSAYFSPLSTMAKARVCQSF